MVGRVARHGTVASSPESSMTQEKQRSDISRSYSGHGDKQAVPRHRSLEPPSPRTKLSQSSPHAGVQSSQPDTDLTGALTSPIIVTRRRMRRVLGRMRMVPSGHGMRPSRRIIMLSGPALHLVSITDRRYTHCTGVRRTSKQKTTAGRPDQRREGVAKPASHAANMPSAGRQMLGPAVPQQRRYTPLSDKALSLSRTKHIRQSESHLRGDQTPPTLESARTG